MAKKKKTKPKAHVLGIVSPKGGVGKTVSTANLAVALANDFNKKVVAIDTNITTASLGFHFNILYPETSIYDVIKKGFSLKWAIHHYNDNLDIIPSTLVIEQKDKDVNTMLKNVSNVSNHYKNLLKKLGNEYEYILLDAAGGFGIEALGTMKVSDSILIVTNPEYPSVVAAAKCVLYANILKVPIAGLVLAKQTNKQYELGVEQIEESLGINVMATIPADENVPKSISHKIPVLLFEPSSKASKAYINLAARILGFEYKPSILERIKNIFRR